MVIEFFLFLEYVFTCQKNNYLCPGIVLFIGYNRIGRNVKWCWC